MTPTASSSREPARKGTGQVPSVAQCTFLILATKTALRLFGLRPTLRWLHGRVQIGPVRCRVDIETIKATEHAVAMAGALYPGRALCLEQSLVLYYLLRRRGAAVRYCQGVHPYPFQAHAWVEYQGEPINDVAEHVKWFTRFPDDLP